MVDRFMRAAAALLLVVACTGCDTAVSILATPTPDEAALQMARRLSEEEIAQAIRFREGLGFRSDGVYVRQMAADPNASMEWSVPLTAAEVAELEDRMANSEGAGAVTEHYAAMFPDEYGGDYLDHENGGAVTVLFTANLAKHQAALGRLFRPGTRFAVRQVRWPYQVLRQLQDRIAADAEWMRTVRAVMQGVGVDQFKNIVELEISSANPQAPKAIVEHFGAGEMLHVTSDGTGIKLMPTGTIRGRAVDRLGRPVPDLMVDVVGDIPGAGPGGDIGYATREDGRFEIDGVRAISFEVQVKRLIGEGTWTVVGRGRVTVPAGGVGTVLIVVQEP